MGFEVGMEWGGGRRPGQGVCKIGVCVCAYVESCVLVGVQWVGGARVCACLFLGGGWGAGVRRGRCGCVVCAVLLTQQWCVYCCTAVPLCGRRYMECSLHLARLLASCGQEAAAGDLLTQLDAQVNTASVFRLAGALEAIGAARVQSVVLLTAPVKKKVLSDKQLLPHTLSLPHTTFVCRTQPRVVSTGAPCSVCVSPSTGVFCGLYFDCVCCSPPPNTHPTPVAG